MPKGIPIDWDKDDIGLQVQNLHPVARITDIANYVTLNLHTVNTYLRDFSFNRIDYNHKYIKTLREEVFGALCSSRQTTKECRCCGSKTALTLEHINQNGIEERRVLANGPITKRPANHKTLRMIRDGELSLENYEILCIMCNMATYNNGGICPHKERKPRTSAGKRIHDKAIRKIGGCENPICFVEGCGISWMEFLEIEHTNADGYKDIYKTGGRLHLAIIREDRKIDDLRVSCANHNHILRFRPEEIDFKH